jgi:hypothetical protein
MIRLLTAGRWSVLERVLESLPSTYLLGWNIRYEEDLIDRLFNSSEKSLARILPLLSHFDKERKPETVVPRIRQETLAEMVGTRAPGLASSCAGSDKWALLTTTARACKFTVHCYTSCSSTNFPTNFNFAWFISAFRTDAVLRGCAISFVTRDNSAWADSLRALCLCIHCAYTDCVTNPRAMMVTLARPPRLRAGWFLIAEHRLLQLRVTLVCDGYNVQQHLAGIKTTQMFLYGRKDADL